MSAQPTIKLEQLEVLDDENVLSELDSLSGLHSELQTLFNLTESAGFTEVARSAYGWQIKVEAAGEVTPGPDDDPGGGPVSSLTSRALFKGFTGGGGAAPNLLAVGTMTVTAGSHEHTEYLQFEAPNGDIGRMIERKVDEGGALVVVDGWWDRFRGCLGGCGGVCLAALGGCAGAGALPAILGCLAIRCGGCAAKCAACATCDCRWWCKWAAGCCRG